MLIRLGLGSLQAVAVSSALARVFGTALSSLLMHRFFLFKSFVFIFPSKAWPARPLYSCLRCLHSGNGTHRKPHDTQVEQLYYPEIMRSAISAKACTLGGGRQPDILGDGPLHLPLHVLLWSRRLQLPLGPNG